MPLPSDLLCARIVVQRGLASDDMVRECLELQAKNRAVGYDEPLPAVLLKRGYISPDDARALERDLVLGHFIRAERAFTKICVDEGLITTEQGMELLEQQRNEGFRARIGDRLIERRVLDPATRESLAAETLRRIDAEDEAARREEQAQRPGAAPSAPLGGAPMAGATLPADIEPPQGTFRSAESALAAFQDDRRRLSSSSISLQAAITAGSDSVEVEGMELEARLGQGTLGVTWKARPTAGGPPVALKVLSPSLTRSPELMARFQRAFERAQSLNHPSLVRLGPLARSGELAYFTTELIDGESLAVRVERSGPLPAARARDVAREIARALAHVHGQRLLHGAIRPSNVFLGRDGSVKVSDLMLTRVVPRLAGPGSESDPSRLYASPEELTGAAAPDPRDDVYSFGLTLAFALTGRPPFQDAQPSQRLMGSVDPRVDNPKADPRLSDIVVRATAPSRQDRYHDGGEVIAVVDPGRLSDRLAKTPPDGAPLLASLPEQPAPPAPPARTATGRYTGERVAAQLPPTTPSPPLPPLPPSPAAAPGTTTGAVRRTTSFRAPVVPETPAPSPPAIPSPAAPAASALVSSPTGPALRRGFDATDDTHDSVPPPSRERTRRRSSLGSLRGPAGADLTGQVVNGRYRILGQLGEGGMGVVYRAEHLRLAKTIAVKVLHPSLAKTEESIARFQREVLAMAQFTHRNVVRILDAGRTEDGRPYMAMELVEGHDLAHALELSERLPPARAVAVLRQVLRAVGEGHAKGIVHRDLKPENVLLATGPAGEEVVKVMDFGIAKILEADGAGAGNQSATGFRTVERVVLGTPEYMSPEQASGAPVDSRSDLYSLGVIAYELLLGRLPFDADSPVGFIGKHIVDPPLSFDEALPGHGLSPALESFVLKALEKDPQERFQTADEMLRALEEAAPGESQLAVEAGVAARNFPAPTVTPRPDEPIPQPGDSSRKRTGKPGDSNRKPAPQPLEADSTEASEPGLMPLHVSSPEPDLDSGDEPVPAKSKGKASPPPPAAPGTRTKKGPRPEPPSAPAPTRKGPPVALLAGAGVVAIVLAVVLGFVVVSLRKPALKTRIAKAQEESSAAVAKLDWEAAKLPWKNLEAESSPEEVAEIHPRLEKVLADEKAALDRAARAKAFEKAVALAKRALAADEVFDEAGLEGAVKAALESASDKAEQDAAAALEQRSKVRLEWQRGAALARDPTTLDPALEHLTAALRASTDPAEQRKLEDVIVTVNGDIFFREARRETSAKQYAEARRDVLKAMTYRETPERQELLEKIQSALEQIESTDRRQRIEQTADEGDRLAKQERLEDARERYRQARADAERPPALTGKLDELSSRIADLDARIAAIAAYAKLPPLPPAGSSESAVKEAIARREDYLKATPAGPRSDRVRAELSKIKDAAQSSAEGQTRARSADAIAKVRAAIDADNEDEARARLDDLRKVAQGAAGSLDADVQKLADEIDGHAKLVASLRRDFVLVPAGKRPAGWDGPDLAAFYLGRTEVTNAEVLDLLPQGSPRRGHLAPRRPVEEGRPRRGARAAAARRRALALARRLGGRPRPRPARGQAARAQASPRQGQLPRERDLVRGRAGLLRLAHGERSQGTEDPVPAAARGRVGARGARRRRTPLPLGQRLRGRRGELEVRLARARRREGLGARHEPLPRDPHGRQRRRDPRRRVPRPRDRRQGPGLVRRQGRLVPLVRPGAALDHGAQVARQGRANRAQSGLGFQDPGRAGEVDDAAGRSPRGCSASRPGVEREPWPTASPRTSWSRAWPKLSAARATSARSWRRPSLAAARRPCASRSASGARRAISARRSPASKASVRSARSRSRRASWPRARARS